MYKYLWIFLCVSVFMLPPAEAAQLVKNPTAEKAVSKKKKGKRYKLKKKRANAVVPAKKKPSIPKQDAIPVFRFSS